MFQRKSPKNQANTGKCGLLANTPVVFSVQLLRCNLFIQMGLRTGKQAQAGLV
jgi:hypothetical protein